MSFSLKLLKAVLVLYVAIFAVTARASLIGDTVTVTSYFQDMVTDQIDVVVGPGVEVDSSFDSLVTNEFYDITGESIIGHYEPITFGPTFEHVFSDLDWVNPGPGAIIGLNLISDNGAFGADRLSFTADSVTINLSNLEALVEFTIELETEHTVPEPATLALMGLGLVGIGYRRHRSKKAA